MLQEKNQELHSKMGIKGECSIKLFGEDGKLKEERLIHNTVTELLDAQVADQLADVPTDGQIGFMGVGIGTGQTSADVGLDSATDNNALTSSTQGAGVADNDLVIIASWAAGEATAALTEAGIFLADNNTTMMTYASFAVINKGAADTLEITWTLTFGAS